jgi:hypothetical protein
MKRDCVELYFCATLFLAKIVILQNNSIATYPPLHIIFVINSLAKVSHYIRESFIDYLLTFLLKAIKAQNENGLSLKFKSEIFPTFLLREITFTVRFDYHLLF